MKKEIIFFITCLVFFSFLYSNVLPGVKKTKYKVIENIEYKKFKRRQISLNDSKQLEQDYMFSKKFRKKKRFFLVGLGFAWSLITIYAVFSKPVRHRIEEMFSNNDK